MKMSAFWDVVPFGLVEFDRRFRSAYCFDHQGDEDSTSDEAGSGHL
jgi:hypothetical protein